MKMKTFVVFDAL